MVIEIKLLLIAIQLIVLCDKWSNMSMIQRFQNVSRCFIEVSCLAHLCPLVYPHSRSVCDPDNSCFFSNISDFDVFSIYMWPKARIKITSWQWHCCLKISRLSPLKMSIRKTFNDEYRPIIVRKQAFSSTSL